jgi:hypothetical protein
MEKTQSPHVDVLSFPGNIGRLACRPENRSSPVRRNYLTSLVGLVLAFAFGAAAAETAGPPADYKIDPEYTSTSPDGATVAASIVQET